jgi:hypothetical protein
VSSGFLAGTATGDDTPGRRPPGVPALVHAPCFPVSSASMESEAVCVLPAGATLGDRPLWDAAERALPVSQPNPG